MTVARPTRPIRRVLLLLAVLAAMLSVAGAQVPAGASSGLLGRLLDFGCANPANRTSATLLPATDESIAQGVRCFGVMRPSVTGAAQGLTPKQLRTAYGLIGKLGAGRTVAIVDAYDDPNIESDLAVYRKYFGLSACTTANGCFRKVNEHGQTSPLPAGDYGWGEEITLDVEAVSATCPDCRILLVEAESTDTVPLMTAVNTAVRLGAVAVSNSYGGAEDKTIRTYDRDLHHLGVAITASSGDDGYGVSWPASSPYVTAVGGTTLHRSTNARGWTESVWSGAGSGCSKYEPKPSWQHDTGCSRRTVADVAAVADPATGLAVYGTYNNCLLGICDSPIGGPIGQGLNGWAEVGGTSLASPVVASVYAIAGHKVSNGSYPYAHPTGLNDVTSGSNGSCGGSYLCTGRARYDGPTGLGTPKGISAF